ncbi:ABC transporter substrate-binding protein [Bacillus sp. Marseille-Q3570]|uniref:ABC transporter substrate-binding protein n=1 Tax=Bacillus sp. Marseille-Q3570 TaxID=2963522 RepID=UPI0021B747DD|nr:ABC transporter substrate-binding protein [Bacillus sp. Marseille-Q3570]
MRKKYLVGFIAVLMIVSTVLSGCTGTGPEGNASQEVTADGKTVLNFWTPQWDDLSADWFKKNIDAYNKSQDDVVVKVEFIPGDAWDQKIKAAQAAGTSPDITTMNYNKIIFSAQQGTIKPLDDYVDSKIWEDLYENVNEFVSYDGKHYAYPMLLEPSSILYYRKDFFEEAGLDPDSPPKTWDEWIEYGKKLKQGKRVGLAAAGNTTELGWTHWGLQAMVGGSPVNEDWSEATINSEPYEKLLTFWSNLYKEGILPKQAPGPYTDIKPLAEGRAAMQINGSWGISELRNSYPDVLDKIGIAPVPTPDGNQDVPTASLGGWTLTIDGNSEHPQEAADFISYLLADDPEIMIDFFKNVTKFSKFSARKSVDEALKSDPDAQNDEWRKMIAEEVVPYAVAEPIYAWDFSMSYANAVERVYLNKKNVKESLAIAEKEINEYIKVNNYAGTNPNQ